MIRQGPRLFGIDRGSERTAETESRNKIVAALFAGILGLMVLASAMHNLAMAAEPDGPSLRLSLAGAPSIIFDPSRDACDGADVPDAPLRAFRDASGQIVAFGMHDVGRALRGPSLDKLKLDCHVVLASGHQSDPAAYDDHNWITATWTRDGRTVDALVHHEYHADEHPGRCAFRDFMSCWYNAITAYRSYDGGQSFTKNPAGFVVAAPPFKQEVGQGRHRGFFNPSNIVADGRYFYFMASTTGWPGQGAGVCLFRTADPSDSASWRAFDGTEFNARFADPYTERGAPPAAATPCRPVAPFPTPVGAIVRYRPSGDWLALFQAKEDATYFAVSGFYYATSRDLLHWSTPRLLLMGNTLYDDACKSGGELINYPSLLDATSAGRNFVNVGENARLFYVTLAVDGCSVTSRRDLLSEPVQIERIAGGRP